MQNILRVRVYLIGENPRLSGKQLTSPIFPCFLVRFFVAVPEGNLSHFQEPTRSYLEGSEDELESAKSTVTLTCVSTRDLAPPSGMLGNIIGRLERVKWCHQITLNSNILEA